ncbi:MAG TPA: hypothetical protein PKA64_12290 [Myxococcota bacterium]|nr:hypothetical protein [Myxococcota bacterium]
MIASLILFVACTSGSSPDGKGSDAPTDDTDAPGGVDQPTSALVSPTCTDGQWREALADPSLSIADLKRSFDDLGAAGFLSAALEVRYPAGAYVFAGGLATDRMGDCLTTFTSNRDRASAAGMLEAAGTLVHECGHFFDISEATGRGSTYVLTETVRFTCSGGSYADTPARSLINGDAWAPKRPACPGSGPRGCDDYANIYLDGDPDDRNFDSGDQGLDTVLEETVQYVNSLATDYAFSDRLGSGRSVSARDGILTFLWYLERYLALMRVEAPAVHARVLDDACWRDAILSVWGRAWLYLEATDGMTTLGIDDRDLEALVTDPALLAEIDAVRAAEGCPP